MARYRVKNCHVASKTLFAAAVGMAAAIACQPPGPSPERLKARWHSNQGVVYMDQHNYVKAREHFEAAIATDSSYPLAHANHGISLFSLGKYDSALVSLSSALELDPGLLHAHYTRGLIFHAQGKEAENALAAFQAVVAVDADDPLVHYYLGRTLAKLQREHEAIAEFEKAIDLDANNVSAHYALAHQLRLQKRMKEWRAALQKFDELSKAGHEGVSSSYQGQGKYAEALTDGSYEDEATASANILLSFASPVDTGIESVSAATSVAGADGLPGVAAATAEGLVVLVNLDGSLTPSDHWRFPAVDGSVSDLAFGDLDADADVDLVTSGESSTALSQEDGRFAAVGPLGGASARSILADIDHDGDLDVLLVHADANHLLANDGTSLWADITERAGVVAPGGREAVFADFDNDRDVDFLVLTAAGQGQLYENNRDGTFGERAGERGVLSLAQDGSAVVDFAVGDFAPDGAMDIASASDAGVVSLLANAGRRFEARASHAMDIAGVSGLRAADLDNDGDLDLVAYGSGGVRMLQGTIDGFAPAGGGLLEEAATRVALLDDFDGDGDVDLWRDGQLHLNTSAAGGSWVKIALTGLNSSPHGIGAKVEVKTASRQQKREVRGGSRSPQVLSFGLADADSVEFIRVLWPSGVRQTELATAARQRLNLTELNRKGTSCPILYAWDGDEFRFVTDFLGGAIIGYLVGPGQYNTPDTDEYVLVGELVPKDGRYVLQAANQLEEVIYLDAAALVAVDHPPSVRVHPNERLLSSPPYPEFGIRALSEWRPPVAAHDREGSDVLSRLLFVDDVWYDSFDERRIHGYAFEHSLLLDLGDLSGWKRPALLAYGWVDYAHSTSNWAAAQNGLELFSPRLEVPDGRGGWRVAIADIGCPAGLPKHMLVDLTALPQGTRRVRITTNAAVYWDQILIAEVDESAAVKIHRRGFDAADLQWRGYPEHSAINGSFAYRYDYDRLNPYTDWGTHSGSFTRLGEVTELLREVDDRYVIMFHGDELTMELDETQLPQLPEGMVRTFLFYADGFGKDMDFHSAASLTVDPLPFHEMSSYPYPSTESYPTTPEHMDYLLEYNTRRVAGNYD